MLYKNIVIKPTYITKILNNNLVKCWEIKKRRIISKYNALITMGPNSPTKGLKPTAQTRILYKHYLLCLKLQYERNHWNSIAVSNAKQKRFLFYFLLKTKLLKEKLIIGQTNWIKIVFRIMSIYITIILRNCSSVSSVVA